MADAINGISTDTEEMPQEFWELILFAFLVDMPINEWNEFSNDLIYKNRFSSSHKIVDIIDRCADKCKHIIGKGTVLYRARIYDKDPLQEFLQDCFKQLGGKNDKIHPDMVNALGKFQGMQIAAFMTSMDKETAKSEEVREYYKKWKRKRFKGYNSEGSGIPPADKTSPGRINPEKISYLYLSEDPWTAAYEVRPIISQHISVAKFKTTEDIIVYDLTRDPNVDIEHNKNNDNLLLDIIQKQFSEPNSGNPFKYLPTQYLSEKIKGMGFDGIRFKSSLKYDGINVVLFDNKKCKAVSSDIIRVEEIKMKFTKPDIYSLDSPMKRD